jgi:hypothetical protein
LPSEGAEPPGQEAAGVRLVRIGPELRQLYGGRWCGNNLIPMPPPRCHAKPTGACASARSRISGIPGSRWSGSWA